MTREIPITTSNPDRSRERSLYFLLVTAGRQKSASVRKENPELAAMIREVISSLRVERAPEGLWQISFKKMGLEQTTSISRNLFKFYNVAREGVSSEDVAGANLSAAERFWEGVISGSPTFEEKSEFRFRFNLKESVQVVKSSNFGRLGLFIFLLFPSLLSLNLSILFLSASLLSGKLSRRLVLALGSAAIIIWTIIEPETILDSRPWPSAQSIVVVFAVLLTQLGITLRKRIARFAEVITACFALASVLTILVLAPSLLSLGLSVCLVLWVSPFVFAERRIPLAVSVVFVGGMLIGSAIFTFLNSSLTLHIALVAFYGLGLAVLNATLFGSLPALSRYAPVALSGPLFASTLSSVGFGSLPALNQLIVFLLALAPGTILLGQVVSRSRF